MKNGPLYLGVALGGETGEIQNKIKKWYRDEWTIDELVEAIKDEMADVLIYLVMLADYLGVDLQDEYIAKKEYNDRRYLKGV